MSLERNFQPSCIVFYSRTKLSIPKFSLNNVFSQNGWTALRRASSSGHTDVVKLLVDSGAQIDNKDKVSTEPCMVLHCDSSLTISIFPLPLTLSHFPSLPLLSPPLSPLPCGSYFCCCLSILI